jgi:hypothetical protein
MTNRISRFASVAALMLMVGCATQRTAPATTPGEAAFTEACSKAELRKALVDPGGQEQERVSRLCESAFAICQKGPDSATCQNDLNKYGFGK